jgi:histidyl-tRNA synthetase
LVAPTPDKFGKQIRFADRRGIPFVWFPDVSPDRSRGDEVKDLRSGEQVASDPLQWRPPRDDEHPGVVLP